MSDPEAETITAGKFLEHFTAYDWIRLDMAGPVFVPTAIADLTEPATA